MRYILPLAIILTISPAHAATMKSKLAAYKTLIRNERELQARFPECKNLISDQCFDHDERMRLYEREK
jgi:hypothetical protein